MLRDSGVLQSGEVALLDRYFQRWGKGSIEWMCHSPLRMTDQKWTGLEVDLIVYIRSDPGLLQVMPASDWSKLLILTSHWSGADSEAGPGGGRGAQPGVPGDSPWEARAGNAGHWLVNTLKTYFSLVIAVAGQRQTPQTRPRGGECRMEEFIISKESLTSHRWKPGHWNIHQKCQEMG